MKIRDFITKHSLIITIILLLLLTFQTCNKNRKINRITKDRNKLVIQNDSLSKLIPTEGNLMILRYKTEFGVYNKLNDEMSKLNRQEQMMNFQNQFIIPPKEDLENKIKALEK
jgi:hypothetical protein